ncbi:hypothetical protein [Dokdonella soli]|uniref:Uncharacterized protein n=1 Tax=Dokdonella soli TaxID=529810 RepID=A0ABN1J0K1_9GAMM
MFERAVLLIALLLSMPSSAAGLGVAACISMDSEGPALRFAIANDTGGSISIPKSNLPWREDGAIVIAYRGDALIGKVMKRAYPVQDSVADNVILRNGEKKTGELVLKYLYPEFAKLDDSSSVIILWAYVPHGNSAEDVTFGGALTLRDKDRCAK